ncbi:unnamed protein product [Adineta steineri]|uniref:Fibronectin type-III domain-containing protein n=1 Tax=Adineta steineri TaxID=433720 RepID=A0A819NIZ7_9BILA|nr:unnamed protein product [Adineta steineri]CAF3995734.1 unnamed protein product [Adineta steineri]
MFLHHQPKPDDPLEATNVTAEGCTLQWKPPMIVIMITCDDKGLEDGNNCEFYVAAENDNGLSEPLVVSTPLKAKWSFKSPDAPDTSEYIEHTSESITLQWTRPLIDGVNRVRGCLLEKKEKGSDRWILVNLEPVAGTKYTVSGLVDGKEYEFRVAAVNKVGSEES